MEEKKTFSVGDVVRLKSGSPAMTVGPLTADESGVDCLWYDHTSGEIRSEFIPAECLELLSAHPI